MKTSQVEATALIQAGAKTGEDEPSRSNGAYTGRCEDKKREGEGLTNLESVSKIGRFPKTLKSAQGDKQSGSLKTR